MSKTISPNTTIAQYTIVSKIGEGGMGEVWRARDPKLGRDVAIKVLPASLSENTERLIRFEQEARAAGALNHPNILVIHHIGLHDGAPYIVSELLEGETLRERIAGAALPQRKAIDFALQIAKGLAAAHDKGITHRDIKPDNIFITDDGRVKILDFGLAKLTNRPGDGVTGRGGEEDPTIAQSPSPPNLTPLTEPGTVMGTVGYMSPEQLKGLPADHRSDIFSFGANLYEMLSGKRAFSGNSAAETMSAILNEDPPDISETNGSVSPALERVVRHCLEKNPAERFRSAHDLGFALEALTAPFDSSLKSVASSGIAPHQGTAGSLGLLGNFRLAWIVAGVFVLSSLGLGWMYFTRPATGDVRVMRLSILPPEKATLVPGQAPTLSPDGAHIVFAVMDATGRTLLYLRSLDAPAAKLLVGTEGGAFPFWSPSSRELGFFAGGKLKKIGINGGQPVTLADAPVPRGGSWSQDDVIIFAPAPPAPILRISAAGGGPTPLHTVDYDHGESPRWFPQFLPDGRHYLFLSTGSRKAGTRFIGIASLDSPEVKAVLTTDFTAVYTKPGYLLFRREATLMAQKFDADRLEVSGDSFPVAEQIGFDGLTYQTLVSASDQGVLAYQSLGAGKTQLVWFDRSDKKLGVVGATGDYSDLALSPDEKQLAFSRLDPNTGNVDVWLMDLTTGVPSRLTFDTAVDFSPVWSPDGKQIVFASLREGVPNLFQKMANGSGPEVLLYRSPLAKLPSDWSLDGHFLLCSLIDPKTRFDLSVISITDSRKAESFLQTPANERRAMFSPNGRWVVYESDESGKKEIYVQSFPASGAKWQVSESGGSQPRWRRDGKELFYLRDDGKITSLDVNTEAPTFIHGTPKTLLNTPLSKGEALPGNQYVVTPTGQRLLVNILAEEGANATISLVLNWNAGLKK